MENVVTVNGIIKTYRTESARAIKFYDGLKEGTKQCQIRQVVSVDTQYPSTSFENNKSDNLFSQADFSAVSVSEPFNQTADRSTFMTVPEDKTLEEIQDMLDSYPQAFIYREISNHPILNDNQLSSILSGVNKKTMEEYAWEQKIIDPSQKDLTLILDILGKPQYQSYFFSLTKDADVDSRNKVADDFFSSPEIMNLLDADATRVESTGKPEETLPF